MNGSSLLRKIAVACALERAVATTRQGPGEDLSEPALSGDQITGPGGPTNQTPRHVPDPRKRSTWSDV